MISVIVPCFNEEAVLAKTFERLRTVFSTFNEPIELIFVDDGSSDQTSSILAGFRSEPNLRVVPVHFSRNFGHSAAVMAGIHACSGDVVGIIDADLQYPPELLPAMIEKLKSGFDIVYGKRIQRKSETLFKKSTAWMFYRLLRFMTNVDIPADTGDFRVMTKEVADVLKNQITEQDPFLRGVIAWVGFRQFPFAYERDGRAAGETKYTFRKMVRFAMTGILGFSNAPLYLGVYVAFASAAVAAGSLFYLIYLKYNAFTVPGWVSLMAVVAIFAALQFLLFGIIGAYIARINTLATNRPIFIARKSR